MIDLREIKCELIRKLNEFIFNLSASSTIINASRMVIKYANTMTGIINQKLMLEIRKNVHDPAMARTSRITSVQGK